LSGGKNCVRKRVVRSSQVEMDPVGRRSSQLMAWSRREKQNRRKRVVFHVAPLRSMESTILRKSLRCWIGFSDISSWNAHPFCTNRMMSDHRGHLGSFGKLNGVSVALVARSGVISKGTGSV
ncbi:hypothetical protein Tco_0049622, partial [Tanacetum coccineum]